MGACCSDSNINQKPDRFNVRKLPNEVVLDTEYAIKKQDPDINFYYNDRKQRKTAGLEIIERQDKDEVTIYTF